MIKKLVLFLLLPLIGYSAGRLTECTFGIGYRSDRIRTTEISSVNPFRVKEHQIHSLLESFHLETVADQLFLGLDLDYGILLFGKRTIENPFINTTPRTFSFNDDYGYETDVFPKIGYSISLAEGEYNCFFLLDFGYGYSRVSLRTKNPAKIDNAFSQNLVFDTRSFRYEWFGPFLEGKLDIFQYARFRCFFGYQYHFLKGKSRQPLFFEETFFANGELTEVQEFSSPLKIKISSGYKQAVEIGIFYLSTDKCSLGFEGFVTKGKSWKAHQTRAVQKEIFSPLSSSQMSQTVESRKMRESWLNFSVLLSALIWF